MPATADLSYPNSPTSPSSDSNNDYLKPTTPPTTPDATAGNDMLARVVQGAHQTIDKLADTAAPHVQKLQEGVASAGEMVSDRTAQARELGDEWAEALRTTVRDNPITAVVTALALGLLVARITR